MSRSTIKAAIDNIGTQTQPLSITPVMIANALNAFLFEVYTQGELNTLLSAKANISDVETALANKANLNHTHSYLASLAGGRLGVYQNEGDEHIYIALFKNNVMHEFTLTPDDLAKFLQPDSTPTANSTKLVTSGGVAAALGGKMDTKVIDSAPTNNADRLVSSQGVYIALGKKENIRPALDVMVTTSDGKKFLQEDSTGDFVDFIRLLWSDLATDMVSPATLLIHANELEAIENCSCFFHLFDTITTVNARFAFCIVLNGDVYQVNGTVADPQEGTGFTLDHAELQYMDDMFTFQLHDS